MKSTAKNKMRICLVEGIDPSYLGGISRYVNNLLPALKDLDVTWIYRGNQDKEYLKDNVKYIEIKTPKIQLLNDFIFNYKCKKFLEKENFDLINSHATWGFWMKRYSREKKQRIIHTYHGSTYFFFKNHLKRYGFLKKTVLSPILVQSKIIEKPPWDNADRIICVSNHLQKELEILYGKRKEIHVLRTGVDLKSFKVCSRLNARKFLDLESKKKYGLYVGRGGFWTKGLDKVIQLSEEMHREDPDYTLLVVGADESRAGDMLKKNFIQVFPPADRQKLPYYYNAADVFFSMSRCEGGAPTMVTSEAMASGCLIVTNREANQEIFSDGRNGIVLSRDYQFEARRMLGILRNSKEKNFLISNSLKTIKKLSIESWREEYLKILGVPNEK